MSEAEEYDSVRVSADGVRVLKRYAADQFPVPAIAFEISSGRDEQVTVRLSDRVPRGVAVDDLGFHPDYGSEYWTIEEDRITFERDLEPDASYTTVYGIRAADDVSQFLSEPTIETVDPPLPKTDSDDDIVLESDDALVEDAISGGIETDEETNTEETADGPDVPSTLDLNGPVESSSADASDAAAETGPSADDIRADTGPSADDIGAETGPSADDIGAETGPSADDTAADTSPGGAGGAVVPEGDVVGMLAAELRDGNVSEEDLDLLREVLIEEDTAGSTAARLDRLQQDVADLRAYTSAIEQFLDENGTGAELIASFEEQLDEFADELESFGDRIEHLETEFVVEVRGRIDDLEDQFEQFESDLAAGLDQIDEMDQRADRIAERADDADARTTELVGRLDDIESDIDRLDDIESDIDRLDDIESDLDRLDDIESDLDRLDDIEAQLEEMDRLDDIEQQLEEIQAWREQLINTLGG
jgi:hypothetical protein